MSKVFSYNSRNVKTLVSKVNTTLEETNKKFHTQLTCSLIECNNMYSVIDLRNENSGLHTEIALRNNNSAVEVVAYNHSFLAVSLTSVRSFLCIFVADFLINNNQAETVEIVASKTLCGVNMRLIRNKYSMAWVETNALVQAVQAALCICTNITVSEKGRVGTTNKLRDDIEYRVVGEGNVWHTFAEVSESVQRLNN
jgi:uncharacterized protein YoxC